MQTFSLQDFFSFPSSLFHYLYDYEPGLLERRMDFFTYLQNFGNKFVTSSCHLKTKLAYYFPTV